jgi:uncharacterized protein YehS (DUF1456 family)
MINNDVMRRVRYIFDFNDAKMVEIFAQARGKREGVEAPVERKLTNNIIFMKLKIALNMQAEAVLETMDLSGFKISKHELSAFFRKPENRQYRACNDQIMRNFLKGLQIKTRGESDNDAEEDAV